MKDSVWAWLWFEITTGPQNLTTACQKRLVNDNWLSDGRWHERERVSSGRVFFNQTFTSVLSTSWRPSRLCYCTISLVGVSHHRAKSVISIIQVLIYGESPLPHLKSSLHLIPYLATRLVPFQSESQFRYRSRSRPRTDTLPEYLWQGLCSPSLRPASSFSGFTSNTTLPIIVYSPSTLDRLCISVISGKKESRWEPLAVILCWASFHNTQYILQKCISLSVFVSCFPVKSSERL